MATDFASSGHGIGGTIGWIVGGAFGGALGAIALGLVLWAVDPEVLAVAIPAIYGIEPAGTVGWAIHLGHGAVLGVIFGAIVTRPRVLGALRQDVETEALTYRGSFVRIAATGFVFGLAVWAVLPVLVLPVFVGWVGAGEAAEFPGFAVESMVGHLLFGTILGIVFALAVDVHDRPADTAYWE